MPPARVVVASGNQGKLREYSILLAAAGIEAVPLDQDVEETASTYEENARLKAEAACLQTGLPTLSDDAGVEVDALDGFPGIRSARLGRDQAERTARLLERLAGKPRPWTARFVAAVALAVPGEPTVITRGQRAGEIIPDWRGTVGFGYDPIFLIPETGRTFGEMPPAEKQAWSHRGAAFRKLQETGVFDRLLGSAESLRRGASGNA